MGLFKLLTDPGNFQFYWQNQKPGSESPNVVNPRKIPFGKDRFKGGSSKEPYIVKSPTFADDDTKSAPFYNDFILRGGILAPSSATEDVTRLTRYFSDLNNPKGALFVTKQNILSKTGVKTEATKGFAYLGGTSNEGYYNPLSTLTQAGVGFLGTHVNKQGGLFPSNSIKTYQDAIIENNQTVNVFRNRLVALQSQINRPSFDEITQYNLNPAESILIQYSGGPGSVAGAGYTNIRFATGNNNNSPLKALNNPPLSSADSNSLFKTWGPKEFNNLQLKINADSLITEDFRQVLTSDQAYQNSFLSKSPNYVKNNIEDKLGLSNPGSRLRNRSNYATGSIYNGVSTAVDKVNASYIYKNESNVGSQYGKDKNYNDLINFNIAILNNELQVGGPYKKYMHFRAFIDGIADSYNADWNAINYMGRAEKFYKYKGFDRKMSLDFTVAAQSKQEITAMYDKLNFLASSLAPEYLDSVTSGYMAGNIAYITLGGYINDQPGIITSLDFTIPEESPWEIAINESGGPAESKDVRQLPHIIRVSLQFTPIHKFRPEKQSFLNDKLGTDSVKLLEPGNQKYIDQNRPFTTNYDNEGKYTNQQTFTPNNIPIQSKDLVQR
jgi:hypothetical protein